MRHSLDFKVCERDPADGIEKRKREASCKRKWAYHAVPAAIELPGSHSLHAEHGPDLKREMRVTRTSRKVGRPIFRSEPNERAKRGEHLWVGIATSGRDCCKDGDNGVDDKEDCERGRLIDRRLRTQGREGEKDRGEIYGIAKGFARQRSVQEEARKLAGRMNDDDRVKETRRGGG